MPATVLETPASLVAGLSAKVSNEDPSRIGRRWERFHGERISDRVATKLSGDILRVYHDDEGDQSAWFLMTIGHRVAHPADVGSCVDSVESTAA